MDILVKFGVVSLMSASYLKRASLQKPGKSSLGMLQTGFLN